MRQFDSPTWNTTTSRPPAIARVRPSGLKATSELIPVSGTGKASATPLVQSQSQAEPLTSQRTALLGDGLGTTRPSEFVGAAKVLIVLKSSTESTTSVAS